MGRVNLYDLCVITIILETVVVDDDVDNGSDVTHRPNWF